MLCRAEFPMNAIQCLLSPISLRRDRHPFGLAWRSANDVPSTSAPFATATDRAEHVSSGQARLQQDGDRARGRHAGRRCRGRRSPETGPTPAPAAARSDARRVQKPFRPTRAFVFCGANSRLRCGGGNGLGNGLANPFLRRRGPLPRPEESAPPGLGWGRGESEWRGSGWNGLLKSLAVGS